MVPEEQKRCEKYTALHGMCPVSTAPSHAGFKHLLSLCSVVLAADRSKRRPKPLPDPTMASTGMPSRHQTAWHTERYDAK
jgi:hypothetical protein